MTRFLKTLALAGLLAIMASAGAFAQVGQQTTQTATRLDASTGLFGPATGATACSTVNTTAANNTVTITPPSGQFVYITGFYLDITADVTGLTGVATMSTTNITGGPIWSLATVVPTTGENGTFRQVSETFNPPLKSTAPGTAVTFVPSAQSNHVIYCTRVAAYFGS